MSKNFWEAEHIRLRAVEPEDWEVHYQWDMDSQTARNLHKVNYPSSKAHAKKWTEEASTVRPDDDNFDMEIEVLQSGVQVGVIGAHHSDRHNGTFMYGVAIREGFQRNGYASEAILLLMRYFFDELRYQKCNVDVYAWNAGSIHLHEKLGFIKEGQIRRAIYTMGTYHDRLMYGMTIEGFHERYD